MVTNNYDNLLRRIAVGVSNYAATVASYGYDAASRLSVVTNGNETVGYDYLTDSPLIEATVFKQSGDTRLTTSRSYDSLNRLKSINSTGLNFQLRLPSTTPTIRP